MVISHSTFFSKTEKGRIIYRKCIPYADILIFILYLTPLSTEKVEE
jgi:hypothetical protein